MNRAASLAEIVAQKAALHPQVKSKPPRLAASPRASGGPKPVLPIVGRYAGPDDTGVWPDCLGSLYAEVVFMVTPSCTLTDRNENGNGYS
jgi:hypothetical protein